MLTESIAIGLVVGFLFYERIGFSPGGLVVPGYVALFLDRPLVLFCALAIAFVVYGVVRLLAEGTITYSRRRFLLMVIAGFGFQRALEALVFPVVPASTEIQTIGYIIPGLIANDMDRQRVVP